MMSDLKTFADIIEDEAREQIDKIMRSPAFAQSKVRIMPDVHAGKGCVIGFTASMQDKVIPNVVGVDISCGVMGFNLGKREIDFEKLDEVIKKYIPSGLAVRSEPFKDFPFENLKCFEALENIDRLRKSLGTLGSGNHYLEVDHDSLGNKYLIVHTGSRNLGVQVAKYYQEQAIKYCKQKREQERRILIEYHKSTNTANKIPDTLKRYDIEHPPISDDLAYLEGQLMKDYLHDMHICQNFADENRLTILILICAYMGINGEQIKPAFNIRHNYIDLEHNIIRKGAISAQKDEIVLIPINMRDGAILGRGLGNEDFNYSAPHGAGRLMSRKAAKANIQISEVDEAMKDIYSTTYADAIDEAPQAYKPLESILENIKDTVEVIDILKPLYNFKASV